MLPKSLIIGCRKKQLRFLDEPCTVIDDSKEAIEKCKKLKPENEYIETGILSMPFDDNHFDNVMFKDGLHKVTYPKKTLSEISRVMSKNGKLIMSVPVGRTSDFLGKKFPIYERDVIRGHQKYLFTKELLEELLKDFADVNINEKDKFSTAYWYLWGLIDKILFYDLEIDTNGKIYSKNHIILSGLINRLILISAFFGQIFIKKKHYKTFYIEAIK